MRYFTALVKFLNLKQNGLIACEVSFTRHHGAIYLLAIQDLI